MRKCPFPWLIYYTFRLERRAADALWFGFWLAFNILNGIQYFSVYAVMIVAVLWLRAARVREGSLRARFLMHTVLALGTFLALAGWRLATTGWVYRDFPRDFRSFWDVSIWTIGHLTYRPTETQLPGASLEFWETTLYLGPVVIGLGLASLAWGWRWWRTLALLCGWLAAGSGSWYHPSYWLMDMPLFSTMHVVTRWRFMAMLGIALAAASVLARWRVSPRPAFRVLAGARSSSSQRTTSHWDSMSCVSPSVPPRRRTSSRARRRRTSSRYAPPSASRPCCAGTGWSTGSSR